MGSGATSAKKDESLGDIDLDLPKKEGLDNIIQGTDGGSISNGEIEEDNPYEPLPGVAMYDGCRLVTIRAILTGGVLGSLIACSNLYLGMTSTEEPRPSD